MLVVLARKERHVHVIYKAVSKITRNRYFQRRIKDKTLVSADRTPGYVFKLERKGKNLNTEFSDDISEDAVERIESKGKGAIARPRSRRRPRPEQHGTMWSNAHYSDQDMTDTRSQLYTLVVQTRLSLWPGYHQLWDSAHCQSATRTTWNDVEQCALLGPRHDRRTTTAVHSGRTDPLVTAARLPSTVGQRARPVCDHE
ncbi:hypothetical protein J6590_020704 [Homalodisca vitripennis]|nr:hypothetical protein J6590_020704 [Homalodisca vitripennis]